MSTKAQRICDGLQRWYEYNGCADRYDALFSKHCEENGFDDDEALEEELLQTDPEQNILMEFVDENDNVLAEFPYGGKNPKTDDKRKQFILDLIIKLRIFQKDRKGDTLQWHNVVEAVKQELYPLLSTSLGQSVDDLVDSGTLKQHDLSDDAINKVIPKLKTRKLLYSNEIEYIKDLVKRARDFRWEKTQNESTSDAVNQIGDDDILCGSPGLTLNLLFDIYSVHKALLFGQFKFKKYDKMTFFKNLESADFRVFGRGNCAPIVEKYQTAFNLSFHPSYVIHDDIFAVMACHFAVSSLINRISKMKSLCNGKQLRIQSVVVPASITSIYDSEIEHKSSLNHIGDYLKCISPSNVHLCSYIKCDIKEVESMTKILLKLFHLIVQGATTMDFVFVFNRRQLLGDNLTELWMFECAKNECAKLDHLYKNYFIGFEVNVRHTFGNAPLARSWLRFGDEQQLRFYPESLLWIVPRLFARSDRMTAGDMLKRLCGSEYKWGWRVSLDDPIFNRFYHIITEYEHITNNYNRSDSSTDVSNEIACGLRDLLEIKLEYKVYAKLHQFAEEQAFDSDAILEDSLAAERRNDAKNSSIFHYLTLPAFELQFNFRAFRHILLRYQGTVCCSEKALSIDECPWIEDVVMALQRLENSGLNIDASNLQLFDLESIVSSWSHVISVHELLSDDEDHQENKKQIMNHILQRVQCGAGSECKALRVQRQRRRETKRAHRVESKSAADSGKIDVLTDVLFGIHCLALHSETQLRRIPRPRGLQAADSRFKITVSKSEMIDDEDLNNESKQEMNDEAVPGAINFGRSVLCWLPEGVPPRFESLRDELVMNPFSTIDSRLYEHLRMLSAALCESSDLTVDEILTLKAYSDTNDFQAELSKAHWDTASDEDRRSFYQWAMSLYRVHLRSAVPIPEMPTSSSSPRPLFTGLNQLLTLSHELGAYYGPLSTTLSRHVANSFSKNMGQIITYQSSYINPLQFCFGINMESISCHPNEREVMLYHQFLPIQKTKTFGSDPSVLINHLLFSLKSRATPIVRKDAFYKRLGIKWTPSWIPLILSHGLLFKQTKCDEMTVKDRLVQELELNVFELVPLLRGAMFVDDALNLKLKKTQKISADLLSQFVFSVSFHDDIPNDRESYEANDIAELEIPCFSLMGSISDSFGLNVFCKAKDRSFDFVKIDRIMMNRYYLIRDTQCNINETINVRPYDPDTGVGGTLLIKAISDIHIGSDGAIIAEGIGANELLNRGIGDIIAEGIRNAVSRRDSGKNAECYLVLISERSIINEGVVNCKLQSIDLRGGRTICLVAPSFSNQGNIQCDSTIDSIRIICNHFENTGTISPEPEVVINSNLQDGFTPLMVEHLMYILYARTAPVVHKNKFYNNIGIDWLPSWFPFILSHKLLFAETVCNGMTVIDRIGEELQISFAFFELVPLLRDNLFVDNGCNLRLMQTSKITSELLSQFVFAVKFGEEPPTDSTKHQECVPLDCDDFCVECGPLLNFFSGSMVINVFCKAKDESFGFINVHKMPMSRYTFHDEKVASIPVKIAETLNVQHFDEGFGIYGCGGHLLVQSLSSIDIASNGNVITDGPRQFATARRDDMGSRVAVMMISEISIVNDGVLMCKLLSEHRRGARSICLVAPMFVNSGIIQCDSAVDSIRIFCNRFENTGTVTPEPEVIINSDLSCAVPIASLLVDHLIFALFYREERIISTEDFYSKLGLQRLQWNWHEMFWIEWIPRIFSHKLLFAATKCDRMTVIERLGVELRIQFFELVLWMHNSLFVDDYRNLRLKQTPNVNRALLSQFVFAVSFRELPSDATGYEPREPEDFIIECPPVTKYKSECAELRIFCRPKVGAVGFIQIHKLVMSQYISKLDFPLAVANKLYVQPFDSDTGVGGGVLIKANSDIVISRDGSIIADAIEAFNRVWIRDMESRLAITMISHSEILNKGILCCKMTSYQERGNRSICLVAPMVWNRGKIVCGSENDSVRIICSSFKNTGMITLPVEIIIDDKEVAFMVHHLMCALRDRTSPILYNFKEKFFSEMGIDSTSILLEWIPLIWSNQLLFEHSRCSQMIIAERLAAELGVDIFEHVLWIREALFVDTESTLRLRKSEKLTNHLISQFTFKISFGENHEVYNIFCERKMDGDSFIIPCTSLMDSISDSMILSVYLKPKMYSNCHFIKLKAFTMSQYILEGRKNPLVIREEIKANAFDPEIRVNSSMLIKCSSDVDILQTAAIKMSVLTHLAQRNAENRRHCVLSLISKGEVINRGLLQCEPAGQVQRKGVGIYVHSRKFVNKGNVWCAPNVGSIRITCEHFENAGMIYPGPNITVGRGGRQSVRGTSARFKSEQTFSLTVYDHLGHQQGKHPNNLVNYDANNHMGYVSDVPLGSVGDWIIFSINNIETIKPTAVTIVNHDCRAGIKSIALWIGNDDGNWLKICKDITGIHNNRNPKKFNLSLIVSDAQLASQRAHLLMLEIVENWGGGQNRFYRFQLHGYALVDEGDNTGKETKSISRFVPKFKWKK